MLNTTIKSVVDNYINGNLTDAKDGAKGYSAMKLANYMISQYGYTPSRSEIIAFYLKGQNNITYQMSCDSK